MERTKQFYATGPGGELYNENNFPPSIARYLSDEKQVISKYMSRFSALLEVGCGTGSYLDFALCHNKKYLGIDIVEEFVAEAQSKAWECDPYGEKTLILNMDACRLHTNIAQISALDLNPADILIIAPFNCAGNIRDFRRLVYSLGQTGCTHLCFTYKTNHHATCARFDYYRRCGFQGLSCRDTKQGVLFESDEGLHCFAYACDWLNAIASRYLQDFSIVQFGEIGVFYEGRYGHAK